MLFLAWTSVDANTRNEATVSPTNVYFNVSKSFITLYTHIHQYIYAYKAQVHTLKLNSHTHTHKQMYNEKERNCHPLLQGDHNEEDYKKPILCSSEMESLTSICEVILQPLPSNSLNHDHNNINQELINQFTTLSGSKYPIPNKVTSLSTDSKRSIV